MNTEKKVYALQKDVQHPAYKNTKRGTMFTQNEEGHAYLSADQRVAMSSDMVENNPEWFLLKEEDKKQKVKSLVFFGKTFESNTNDYILSITGDELLTEKIDAIKEVINNVLREAIPLQQKEFTEPRGNNFGFNKDYEILSYRNPNVFTDIVGGNIMKPCSIATLRDYPIHSLKRISDNTTWTVGDMVNIGGYKEWEIVGFIEIGIQIFVDLRWSMNGSISTIRSILQELEKI